jgi:hypothetical protein
MTEAEEACMREPPWLVSLDAQEARVRLLAADAAVARANFTLMRHDYRERLRKRFARPWVLGASFVGGFVAGRLAGDEQRNGKRRRAYLGSVATVALWALRFWEQRSSRAHVAAVAPADPASTATDLPTNPPGR